MQYSVSLAAQASEMKAIQDLQVWIAENVQKKLSVQVLADRLAMSVRNFERVFTRDLGRTPSKYLLQVRVEAALLRSVSWGHTRPVSSNFERRQS